MPVESAVDHPTYDFAGNTVTSLIAPSRGAWSACSIASRPRPATDSHHIATTTSIRSRSQPVGVCGAPTRQPLS